jgi:hypothetical protein
MAACLQETTMDGKHFDDLTRVVAGASSRRATLGLVAGSALTAALASFDLAGARKKRKRKKRKKKTCAKAGQPTSKKRKKCCQGLAKNGTGICAAPCTPATCAGTNLCVDGTCQPCDVCASGCFFSSVQAAIAAASAGETIRVCPGIYTGSLLIDQSLTLIGAGDGNGAGNTILHGTGTGAVVTTTSQTQVTLRSLRITGGNAASSFGGGIASFSSPLELIACTVTGNAALSGGGIFNTRTLILTNSVITGNVASAFGGGIHNGGSSDTVTLDAASRVTGNEADPTNPDSGGGIFNFQGTVTLSTAENVTGNDPDNCAGLPPVPMCSD